MANYYPVKAPIENRLSLPVLTKPEVNITTYQQLIGSLIYAIVCTHSNIFYAVKVVACYISAPGHVHTKAVKHIYCYLCGTLDYKLIYQSTEGPNEPVVYLDSDWTGDHNDQKFITGFVTCLSNGAIIWALHKQACVSTSLTEAEFIAAATGCQEALWLYNFFGSIQSSITLPTLLYSND